MHRKHSAAGKILIEQQIVQSKAKEKLDPRKFSAEDIKYLDYVATRDNTHFWGVIFNENI